jgi:hypothetical protein
MSYMPRFIQDILQHAVSCAENEGLLTPEEFRIATKYIDNLPKEEIPECKPSQEPPILRLI